MEMDYERNASGRMFESPFLEACSKIHPAVPFIFYIPIISGLMVHALWSHRTSALQAILFVPLGWVTWDLMEYAIHRGFFHWEGAGPFTRKVHEIIHGYHHRYPDDRKRLVMPLGASIPLGLIVAGLFALITWLTTSPVTIRTLESATVGSMPSSGHSNNETKHLSGMSTRRGTEFWAPSADSACRRTLVRTRACSPRPR